TRRLAKGRTVLGVGRRAVHRPKAHRLAIRCMDEVTLLHLDEAVFTGKLFIQKAQVDRAFGECVRLRIEGKPAIISKGRAGKYQRQTKRDNSAEESAAGSHYEKMDCLLRWFIHESRRCTIRSSHPRTF